MLNGEKNPFTSWRWKQWLILFGVSTGIGLLFVFQNYVGMVQEKGPSYTWSELLIGLLSYWYVWAILFPCIVWLGRRFPLGAGPSAGALRWHIPAFVFVPVLHIAIYSLFLHAVDGAERPFLATSIALMKSGLFFRYLTYAFLLATSYSIDYYRHYRERELRASRLEATLVETRLQSLRNQIHPHFLFNTLNAISSLMHRDVDAADEAIARLAELLRVTLEADGTQEVTLRQELDMLGQYVEIEKLRLGDRLTVDVRVPPGEAAAMVPSMVLQPLVENAIRYGVATRSTPGTVTVSARRDGDEMEIRVTDDGPGLPEGYTEGIGLGNTRARLAQLYGARHSVSVAGETPGGCCVTLRIPFRTDTYEPSTDGTSEPPEDPDAHR